MKHIFSSEIALGFLCTCLLFVPDHLYIKELTDEDIESYFASRTQIIGPSKVNIDDIGIPSWIKHKQAYGYIVIPGYYAAAIQDGGYDEEGESYQQDIIDANDRALWNWNEDIEYFDEKGINTLTDHNFSNNISNNQDPSFPKEADDLYWTKFLPLGSQCYIINRDIRKVTIYQLVNRYEEYEYANYAYHINYDLEEDIKPKYKVIKSGNLLMETCDIDCTDENPHIWITQWEAINMENIS